MYTDFFSYHFNSLFSNSGGRRSVSGCRCTWRAGPSRRSRPPPSTRRARPSHHSTGGRLALAAAESRRPEPLPAPAPAATAATARPARPPPTSAPLSHPPRPLSGPRRRRAAGSTLRAYPASARRQALPRRPRPAAARTGSAAAPDSGRRRPTTDRSVPTRATPRTRCPSARSPTVTRERTVTPVTRATTSTLTHTSQTCRSKACWESRDSRRNNRPFFHQPNPSRAKKSGVCLRHD